MAFVVAAGRVCVCVCACGRFLPLAGPVRVPQWAVLTVLFLAAQVVPT